MIQAIFFDVDGTLVSFRTHTIPASTLEALHALRAKGIKLFLATGRHQAMLRSVQELFPFDGCVTLSGQYCFVGDRVLRSSPMPAGGRWRSWWPPRRGTPSPPFFWRGGHLSQLRQ